MTVGLGAVRAFRLGGTLTGKTCPVLVWVTGISGAGKSTVCRLLRERGVNAHDIDEGDFREWRSKDTNEPITAPARRHDSETMARASFRLRREPVEALKRAPKDEAVFLFGTVDNENEVWDLFDRVVCLTIDERTLRHRLATRSTNEFGKAPHELEAILYWYESTEANYRRFGATIVDASRPADLVADDVVRAARS